MQAEALQRQAGNAAQRLGCKSAPALAAWIPTLHSCWRSCSCVSTLRQAKLQHAAGSWEEVAQCTVRAAFGNARPTHSSLCIAAVAPCREDGAAFSDGDADGKNNGL